MALCTRLRSHHHERRRSSEEELLEMVLRERSAALSAGAGGGFVVNGGSGPASGQMAEQSLVDLLSQGLPAGHPDTDLVAMIMSEVRAASTGCADRL